MPCSTRALPPRGRRLRLPAALLATALLTVAAPGTADAATAPGLGTAASYAILAGSTVTNTNPSVITGDLGLSPGTAVTGFPPGIVQGGVINAANAVALQAQSDLTTAYNTAAAAPKDFDLSAELGSPTPLVPGTYTATSALQLTGSVTLDGQGNPNAVFIFQIPSALTTASNSVVNLIGNASPCNVFWQVGSSAVLGTTTSFVGTIMALTSISLGNSAAIQGRALARNGAVTLDNNVITRPECGVTPTTTSAAPTTTTAPTTTVPTATVPPVVVVPGLPPVTVPPVISIPGLPPITIPGVPPAAGTTTTPNSPVIPGAPVIPATPQSPGTPAIPGMPAIPGSPESPLTPGTPGLPLLPGTPQTPGMPLLPGMPYTTGGGQVTIVPLGGVDTGDGSTAHRA